MLFKKKIQNTMIVQCHICNVTGSYTACFCKGLQDMNRDLDTTNECSITLAIIAA